MKKNVKLFISWGFKFDDKQYGNATDFDIIVEGEGKPGRRKIKGDLMRLLTVVNRYIIWNFQKVLTGETELEDMLDEANKLFEKKKEGVK